jgi:hypothetical protein
MDCRVTPGNDEWRMTAFAQRLRTRVIGRLSTGLLAVIVALVLGFGFLLCWSVFAPLPAWAPPSPLFPKCSLCTDLPTARDAGLRAAGFFLYLMLVALFVTRV